MIIHNIFPTAVGKFELGRDITPEEMTFVKSQPTYKNMGNTTSSNRYVLRDEVFLNLTAFIEASVAEYFKTVYTPKHDVSLRLTQSWLNYTAPGEFHHRHVHPNSFVSGVFYVKAARERDKINFYRDGYQQIKFSSDNYHLHNCESWWFDVGAGDLLLFPSNLTHMVETVQEERISLSFNTFPVGQIGDEENLSVLYIK